MSARGIGILVAALAAVSIFRSVSWAEPAKMAAVSEQPTYVTPSVLPHRVIAYYFHTTYRCASCRTIEAYSHEAIDSAFAGPIKAGRLVWKVVNVEVKGNEHFTKDYQLYTKSLVLVNEERGKPTQWKNLAKVWELLNDKPKFFKYVQAEVDGYLADRP